MKRTQKKPIVKINNNTGLIIGDVQPTGNTIDDLKEDVNVPKSVQDIANKVESETVTEKPDIAESIKNLKTLEVNIVNDDLSASLKKTLFSPRKKEVIKDANNVHKEAEKQDKESVETEIKQTADSKEAKPDEKKKEKIELEQTEIEFGTALLIDLFDWAFHRALSMFDREGDKTSEEQKKRLVQTWGRYLKSLDIKATPLTIALVTTLIIYGMKGYKSKPIRREAKRPDYKPLVEPKSEDKEQQEEVNENGKTETGGLVDDI